MPSQAAILTSYITPPLIIPLIAVAIIAGRAILVLSQGG